MNGEMSEDKVKVAAAQVLNAVSECLTRSSLTQTEQQEVVRIMTEGLNAAMREIETRQDDG